METSVVKYILTGLSVILLTGVSTVGNICLIVVFVQAKQVRTAHNYFFVSLILSGLFVGFGYPLQCLVNLGVLLQLPVCLAATSILLILGQIIIWSLLGLTVERYIAITRPLTAGNIITKTRAIKILAAIVITAVLSGGLVPILLSVTSTREADIEDATNTCRFSNLVPNSGYHMFLMMCRVVSVFVFFLVYAKIFLVVRRHMRVIDSQASQITTTSSVPAATMEQASTSRDEPILSSSMETRKPWTRKVRSSAILFALVTYHALSWIPLMIINIPSSESEGYVLLTLVHFITYSPSALNPVIYGLGNKEVRSALVNLLRPNRHRNTMETNN